MTSEVALLNRSAVALAADSAATVRHWEKDHYEPYYFKGTNKIFQLSSVHPVGIMIYATASLQGAPWDMLIKSYRDQLGSKSHDHLSGYATDLFEYIAGNAFIFGPDVQERQFQADVDIVAARIVGKIAKDDDFKKAPDGLAKVAAVQKILADAKVDIQAAPLLGNADQADIDAALAKYTTMIKEALEKDLFYSSYFGVLDFEELAKLAIDGQFKTGFTNLNSTGIVITGFGDKDYFPRLLAYRCYGLVLGKFILKEETRKCQTISQTNSSAFVSFAQDNMIQTFIFGASAQVMSELDDRFTKATSDFFDSLVAAGLAQNPIGDPASIAKIDELKKKAIDQFGDEFIEYSFQEHSRPMRRVLGALPFDELAELAHTLVLLESLKERVTSSSSSVSGPIDVAVISKNDGFIWIKRKHYFDPKLNPRFFSTRGKIGGSHD